MYEFLVPGFSTEIPKLLSVTLNNDANAKWKGIEGIYEISPDLENGLPKWKMLGGPHEIESLNNMWYIRQDGSNSKFSTHDQSHAIKRLPDDPTYTGSPHFVRFLFFRKPRTK